MNIIPTAHKKEFISDSPYQGKFVIEPLYPGYGLTLGNALRRVLLSSLEGVAISSIRVKGADHEFTALEGVREDLVDIILNLKQAHFDVTGEFEEPIKIELSAKGVKEIKAGDFKKTAGVKIANPDLVLANLTDAKSSFELEAWIEKGRGYLPTESMEDKEREIGVIAIDAMFTPIKRVAIDTENVRVGDMTNWDRLVLDLETDGTISCEDALNKTVSILVEQFQFLLDNKTSREVPMQDRDPDSQSDIGKKPKKRGRFKKEE
ncbi:DNA-directed RNA polymerase subunit alpha [Patescibacteria group bacterium]|nr:DNA-directed RNA polymerase subunit alpha [Patescibacteria group bacterium]